MSKIIQVIFVLIIAFLFTLSALAAINGSKYTTVYLASAIFISVMFIITRFNQIERLIMENKK